MLLSMTGFSSRVINLPIKDQTVIVTLSLKTLNSRFFEVNCKLPYALNALETEFVKQFKAKLHRGNIYFSVHLSTLSVLKGSASPALSTIKSYLTAITAIQEKFGVEGKVTLAELIMLPGVFETPEEMLDAKTTATILESVNLLIEDLIKERTKEGAELEHDLHKRIALMQKSFVDIEPRSEAVIARRKEQLMNTFQTLMQTVTQEVKDQQLQFIYNQLEKMDINEEIVRFQTHIKNLNDTLKSQEEEKGKKLDFILQELFREINTIAAKCADSEISKLTINVKVELEKTREQVQNIV